MAITMREYHIRKGWERRLRDEGSRESRFWNSSLSRCQWAPNQRNYPGGVQVLMGMIGTLAHTDNNTTQHNTIQHLCLLESIARDSPDQ